MKRTLAIVAVVVLFVLAVLLHTPLKDFLWKHPWLQSSLVALPTIALAFFAFLEWRHSGEANDLRRENARLAAELDCERNEHLKQIAKNTERPVTQDERNASILRKHLGAKVAVSEGNGVWSSTPEIVEVSYDNTVTLFTPRSYSSSSAWCVQVRCSDLEISEIPEGSCPLRLKVLKRYGPDVQLGEITKWEERSRPEAAPVFLKGGVVNYARYIKAGSSEARSLSVNVSKDGNNSFLLEASTGERIIGDNREVSKQFMVLQVDYEAEGFRRSNSGMSSSPYPLFIKTG